MKISLLQFTDFYESFLILNYGGKHLLQVFTVQLFLIMLKNGTIDLVFDVCSCLKYESIFHKIHLKETGKSFLSLFQLQIIVGNVCSKFSQFSDV